MPTDPDVVENREISKQGEVLKGAADAEIGDLMGRSSQDRIAVKQDIARGRGVEAAQAVEQGRLARAVRADEPDDQAAVEIE